MRRSVAIMAAAFIVTPALSDTTSGGKTVECYCTDSSGNRVELDEVICLQVDGRAFLARCEMSLNNPIWRDTGVGCLSSSLETGPDAPLDGGIPA